MHWRGLPDDFVSIHAPARGATLVSLRILTTHLSFNPRSRAGSDAMAKVHNDVRNGFNPRSRAGSDQGQMF